MQPARAFFIGILLLNYNSTTVATDRIAAYLQNDDSHPYTVAPGDSARFTIGHSQAAAFMDVKCSLEGDKGYGEPRTGPEGGPLLFAKK